MMKERIQKVLADMGLGSRREIERWIEQGRITINGKMASLGDKVCSRDRVTVDNQPVALRESKQQATRVIAYHKPEGEISTRSDPGNRPTVYQRLPKLEVGRWISIGRLDINTSGLILFTNNGELAHRLMHPSNQIERVYAVRVFGEVSEQTIESLLQGVELEDGKAHFEKIIHTGGDGSNQWYRVSIKEGRYREVRRLWESVGVTVSRLIRIAYGGVALERNLRKGQWRDLSEKQIAMLAKNVDLPLPALRNSDREVTGEQQQPRRRSFNRAPQRRLNRRRA